MALTIKALLEGASIGYNGGVQPYYVKGLEGTNPSVMWAALGAAGLPQPDQPHPTQPGLIVTDVAVAKMSGNFACIVNVSYGVSEAATGGGGSDGDVEIDGSIVAVKTQIDYAGNPILVVYNPTGVQNVIIPATPTTPTIMGAGDRTVGAEVDQYCAMTTYRVTRMEDASPLANSLAYVGKLNDASLFGQDKEAWLCSRIGGTRPLANGKWRNTYELQSLEIGWHRVAVFIDATTGKPPALNMGKIKLNGRRPFVRLPADNVAQDRTVNAGNGLTIVRVQGSADFTALNLPDPQ